jgi:hypothetical protein
VRLPDAHFGDPKEHQVTDKELQSVGEVAIAYAQKESGSATLLPSGFFLRDNVLACRTGTTAHDLVSVIGKINEYRAAQRLDKFALRIECLFRAHEAKVYSIHSNTGDLTTVRSLDLRSTVLTLYRKRIRWPFVPDRRTELFLAVSIFRAVHQSFYCNRPILLVFLPCVASRGLLFATLWLSRVMPFALL